MPTISDVARRAKVSPVTVSRVLNGAANVNPETRARVQQAIQEMGYLPNLAARSLRSRQTRTLGLLVPDITNVFWTTVARGVEDAALGGGYSVLLCNTDENPTKQANYLRVVLQQRVDGVIIAPCDADAEKIIALRERGIPTVVIDRRVDGWDVDTVWSDSIAGARTLVQHLLSLGHREIAMINGPVGASTSDDRLAGYCLALYLAGVPFDPKLVRRGAFNHASGYQQTHRLLEDGLRPTAIFAANNLIATGALQALQERNLRIPQDVALVSFDDLPDVARFFPFLTVVSQPAYDMGLNAAQLLLSRFSNGASLPSRHVILPNRLVLRYSCGRNLAGGGGEAHNLPSPMESPIQTVLVKPLSAQEKEALPLCAPGLALSIPTLDDRLAQLRKPDVNRLVKALRHQPAGGIPYFELAITNRALVAAFLERNPAPEGTGISPADQVEFARRAGIDAVPCEFLWQPGILRQARRLSTPVDLAQFYAPPPLAEQLSCLESYLRAAQGNGVGVFASLSSFAAEAIRGARVSQSGRINAAQRADLENWMEGLLQQQKKVLRAVCDRFAGELAFILIQDHFLGLAGINARSELFNEMIAPRLKRLIAPAREHGLLVGLSTTGYVEKALPAFSEAGFDFVHLAAPAGNPLAALKRRWAGKLALAGGIPTPLLISGAREEIENEVRQICLELIPGGGFALSASGGIPGDVPPENYLAMLKAIQEYGIRTT